MGNKMITDPLGWKEIHGFRSPGEYQTFVKCIDKLINAGDVRELPVDPDYGLGEIYGGRWFLNKRTGEIWRLVPPDFPFKGLWEPVDKEKT